MAATDANCGGSGSGGIAFCTTLEASWKGDPEWRVACHDKHGTLTGKVIKLPAKQLKIKAHNRMLILG